MRIKSNYDAPIAIPREGRTVNRGQSHVMIKKGEEAEVKADNPSFRIWLLAGLVLPADKEAEKLLAELKAEAKKV